MNLNLSRPGQINATGDAWALFLKKFNGEVFRAYEQDNAFLGTLWEKSISGGKSYSFPKIWKANSGRYHIPGTQIVGQKIKHAEKVVTVDQLYINDVTIANIDEVMNHYDIRGPYTDELGRELRRQQNANLARKIVQAARAAPDDFGGDAGNKINGTVIGDTGATHANLYANVANLDTDADALVQAIFKARQALVEKFVPLDGLSLVFKPAQYFLLKSSDSINMNRDFGGGGSVASGSPGMIDGISVRMSNGIPSDNSGDGSDVTGSNNYLTNLTNTLGLMYHKTCVGVVKLMDIAIESDYYVDRQGWLFVAKYAQGADWLRPEGAVEFSSATGAIS